MCFWTYKKKWDVATMTNLRWIFLCERVYFINYFLNSHYLSVHGSAQFAAQMQAIKEPQTFHHHKMHRVFSPARRVTVTRGNNGAIVVFFFFRQIINIMTGYVSALLIVRLHVMFQRTEAISIFWDRFSFCWGMNNLTPIFVTLEVTTILRLKHFLFPLRHVAGPYHITRHT